MTRSITEKLSKRINTEVMLTGDIIGVYFSDLLDNDSLEINSDLKFPSASIIKVFIMAYIMNLVYINKLDINQKFDIKPNSNNRNELGILSNINTPIQLDLRDIITLMIIDSDNVATNILINIIDEDDINDFIKEIKCQDTYISGELNIYHENYSFTTPRDTYIILNKIYNKDLPYSDFMLDVLIRQKYNNRIPFFIVNDISNLKIAHKTGTLDGIAHDIAIIFTERFKYILCVMTKNQKSTTVASIGIARISEIFYQYIKQKYHIQH